MPYLVRAGCACAWRVGACAACVAWRGPRPARARRAAPPRRARCTPRSTRAAAPPAPPAQRHTSPDAPHHTSTHSRHTARVQSPSAHLQQVSLQHEVLQLAERGGRQARALGAGPARARAVRVLHARRRPNEQTIRLSMYRSKHSRRRRSERLLPGVVLVVQARGGLLQLRVEFVRLLSARLRTRTHLSTHASLV